MSDTQNPIEIERKFTLKNDNWKAWSYKTIEMVQGYFTGDTCPVTFDGLHLRIGQFTIKPEEHFVNILPELLVTGTENISPQLCAVRIRSENGLYKLTIKKRIDSNSCHEMEYLIPEGIGRYHLERTDCKLLKTRYLVGIGNNKTAEVDVYHGENSNMPNTAEVEFINQETADSFETPAWFDKELTGMSEFSCKALAETPYNARQK